MNLVVHIISGLEVGGAEMALLRLVSLKPDSNFRHVVIALTPEGAMRNRFQEANIELISLNFRKSPILHFIKLMYLIRKLAPDVVQTWLYHADLIGGLAARLVGHNNIIWGIHSTFLSPNTPQTTQYIRKICAKLSGVIPKHVVCVARAAAAAHIADGYSANRMLVIPNGFDLNHLKCDENQREYFRKELNISQNDILIGCVSRFNEDKDIGNLIKAAGLLCKEFHNVHFLIVGRDLDNRNAALMSWIQAAGCLENVTLLGERTDIPTCLSAMDIFCLPSRTEAFPLAVGEAMAMGKVCVVTDVGDAALLVGNTGKCVPKEDPQALADGLKQIIELAPAKQIEMGAAAKRRIVSEYSIENTYQQYEELYLNFFPSHLEIS